MLSIERVRSILALYDEGASTKGETEGLLFRLGVETLVEASKRDGGEAWIGSWCGPTPPPPEIHTIRIKIGPDQLQVKRADDPTPWLGDDHA